MFKFLKKAFRDMRESARAQHEVDKANFRAHKAEARATWEEAKMSPTGRAEKMQEERDEAIREAEARTAAAEAHIEAARKRR